MTTRAPRVLEAVLDDLRNARVAGRTCDEVEQALGLPHQTVSPRFWELWHSGRIVGTNRRRITRQGRFAKVYVLISFADGSAVR